MTPPPGTSSFCALIAARVLRGENPDRAHINPPQYARHQGSARTHVSAHTQSADHPRGTLPNMPDSLLLLGEAGNLHEGALPRDTTLPPRNGVNLDTNTTLRRGTRRVNRPNEALLVRPPLVNPNDQSHR
jgi:hypothetical protein